MKKYDFGEKQEEYDIKTGNNIPVWQSPKYKESKDKVIEMLESEKYKDVLKESDFWILMNRTKNGKMAYTGLIISHNGCLKINDVLENKVQPDKFEIDKQGYRDSLVISYVDEEVCEFGEVSTSNCKNDYPYAMAYKRCFDRVVLKKSKLAYAGVYSDSEAEEFKEKQEEGMSLLNTLEELLITSEIDRDAMYKKFGVESSSDMTEEQMNEAISIINDWLKKKGNK